VLASLEAVADSTVLALAAAYPELQDFPDPTDYSVTTLAALDVITHLAAMRKTLRRYKTAMLRIPHDDEDDPPSLF
jgi:urea transporter